MGKIEKNKDNYFGFICGYNGSQINIDSQQPDHELFKQHLGDTLISYQEIDYLSNPVFAVAYIKTNKKNDLLEFCDIEFNHYLKNSP